MGVKKEAGEKGHLFEVLRASKIAIKHPGRSNPCPDLDQMKKRGKGDLHCTDHVEDILKTGICEALHAGLTDKVYELSDDGVDEVSCKVLCNHIEKKLGKSLKTAFKDKDIKKFNYCFAVYVGFGMECKLQSDIGFLKFELGLDSDNALPSVWFVRMDRPSQYLN